jgi:hypothetical protein
MADQYVDTLTLGSGGEYQLAIVKAGGHYHVDGKGASIIFTSVPLADHWEARYIEPPGRGVPAVILHGRRKISQQFDRRYGLTPAQKC